MEQQEKTEQALSAKKIKEMKKADVSYRITCNNGNQRTLINP